MNNLYNRSAKNKLFVDLFFAIIAFIFYSFVPLIMAIDSDHLFAYSLVTLVASFGLFLICYRFIRNLDESFQIKKMPFSIGAVVIVAVLFCSFVLQNAIGFFRSQVLPQTQLETSNQDAIANLLQVDDLLIYSLITMVIIAPLFEELIFRRILIGNTFASKKVLVPRIIMSVSVFAMLHVFSEFSSGVIPFLFSLATYLIISGSFTLIYVFTSRMLYSVLAHILNNLLAALLLLSQM